jgi:hypothetical protein
MTRCIGEAITRRLKVTRQNGFFVDALIGEKPVSRLCVGPVSADERSARDLRKQFFESLEKARVLKLTSSEFAVNPVFGLRFVITARAALRRQRFHSAAPTRRTNSRSRKRIFSVLPLLPLSIRIRKARSKVR